MKRNETIPTILLAQNSSVPNNVKNLMDKGYPSGVIVLSISGKTWANLMYLMESGFTLPFSFSKKRKMVITKVMMTIDI